MIKILPLGNPLVKCYLYDAYPLSVLATDNEYLPWFYSNYIQLVCYKNYLYPDRDILNARPWSYIEYKYPNEHTEESHGIFLEFYGPRLAFTSPFLHIELMSWSIFSKMEMDIIKLVKLHIDNDYYFYGYVDDYYIKDRNTYLISHYPHDIFIYGYDDSNEVFYVMGYNERLFYVSTKISYNSFYMAFSNNNFSKDDYFWIDNFYFLKKNHQTKYSFNFEYVSSLLNDYLYSQNTSKKYGQFHNTINHFCYGMEIYQSLQEYFMLLIEGKVNLDLRIANLLWEHKKCMVNRISYINNHYFQSNNLNIIYERYIEIEKMSLDIQKLFIKYILNKNNNIIKKICSILEEIKNKELKIIPEVNNLILMNSIRKPLHNEVL